MKKSLLVVSFSAAMAGMILFASCDWNKKMLPADALTITGATELDICEYDDANHQYILTSGAENFISNSGSSDEKKA